MPVKEATANELELFPFEQRDVVINGRKFTFRELSVQENDDCADGSKDQEGLINARAMMRLMLLASSVEPKLTAKSLAS